MAAGRSYGAIVIEAGQGGKPLPIVLARTGLKTAIVDRRIKSSAVFEFDFDHGAGHADQGLHEKK